MATTKRRVDTLEAAYWLRLVAPHVPAGHTAKAFLAFTVAWFESRSREQQARDLPGYTAAELDEINRTLPELKRVLEGL
jgi:hypothetical protein